MFRKSHHPYRGIALGALAALLAAAGLTGCFRGSWHDAERIERRTNSIIEDVKDDLELRPDQEPAYDALAGKIKAHVIERARIHRETTRGLKTEFEAQTVNPDQVANLLKAHIASRSDRDADNAIVDDAAAFYRTLDAGQQETVNKKVRRVLRWHD